jgi:uncharacterized repeat protein (TIGR03803 family)
VITTPTTATVQQNRATAITGVSISEAPTTSGETFTAVLADSNGVLAANTGAAGGGGTITQSNANTTLTITGSLSQVDADLTTLTDTDPSTAADKITINARDSNGGHASPVTIAVTVTRQPAPALRTLVSFTVNEGGDPSGLIADSAGDLFGTAESTVFEIDKTGSSYSNNPTTLVPLNNAYGAGSYSGVIADAAGNLFGTTYGGGAHGDGTVFEVPVTAYGYATTPTILVSFNGTNGSVLYAGMIADTAGDLFGTTYGGGLGGYGTIFKIAKTTGGYASTPSTLASFNLANGGYPYGGLVMDAAGDLFGTTYTGGANGIFGTVFEIPKTAGGYGKLITLASFNGVNGGYPLAGLIMDAAGDLFGTTYGGGIYGGGTGIGTVFELPKTAGGYGTLIRLVSFNGTNGSGPAAALIMDAAGNLFGTTSGGGSHGGGTVFEIPKRTGLYTRAPTTLVDFNGVNGTGPMAGLMADPFGDLFGSTQAGGADNNGTAFELIRAGF